MEEVPGSFALEDFTLAQMVELSSSLRKIGKGANSMEEASERIVRHLYEHLVSRETGRRACALVRLFKTHAFGQLDDNLRQFARARLAGAPEKPSMKCLVLFATAGEKPEWNSRSGSMGHQAIPLPNEAAIAKAPMISRLLSEMGFSARALLKPDSTLMLEAEHTTFNVFHVPEAPASPYVPAQDFVNAFAVKSVLGFGGVLASHDLFAVILFSRAHIPRATAEAFKTLGLVVKLAIGPFDDDRVFAHWPKEAAKRAPSGTKQDTNIAWPKIRSRG
jgi:hypothetical protein